MGFHFGFGLEGESLLCEGLAGLPDDDVSWVVAGIGSEEEDDWGLGERKRLACTLNGGPASPQPLFRALDVAREARVRCFGRLGEGWRVASSSSEDRTMGCLRAARGFPMPHHIQERV